MTDPLGNQTRFGFDKNGRISSVIDPLSHLSAIVYDAGGRVSTRMDANGKLTKYSYDALGRVVKQTDANDGTMSFTYDSRSNLLTVTDQSGNTTTFAYDLADRMTRETRPMGQATEYAYYPNGLLKTVKDAKGQTTTYAYDKANRLVTRTYQDGAQDAFTYDAVGNIVTYSNASVSGALQYDALNRKKSETINYGSFTKEYSYTYDGKGNKSSYTSPEGALYSYAYNRVNQLTGIAFNGKAITYAYEYDRLVNATLPNGITTDYQYNANSWLTYITTKQGTTTLANYGYSFDNAGNITGKTTEHGDYAYSYDNTYQLANATSPAHNESLTYDKTGNRQSYTLDLTAISYAHNANNELTSADTASYQYDNNGNTVSATKNGQTTAYQYNSANRLETVNLPDGRTATYFYDPFGRRIKKDVAGLITYYAYSDEGLIGEYDQAGNIKKAYGWRPDSIWGTGPIFMVEGGSYYFYHNDTLGTPQKLTDINGNTVWSATYTAFGEATVDQSSIVVNNLRYPGQYYDEETGLHYNWNRYYNPTTGRYTQEDPIGVRGGLNLYKFAKNNSLRFIDPLGLRALTPREKRELLDVFGDNIDVNAIDISSSWWSDYVRRPYSWYGNDIVMPSWYFKDKDCNNELDFSKLYVVASFVHEAMHVWQRQHGDYVTSTSIWPQLKYSTGLHNPYDYQKTTNPQEMLEIFKKGTYEQQGKMIEDYVRDKVKGENTDKYSDVLDYIEHRSR